MAWFGAQSPDDNKEDHVFIIVGVMALLILLAILRGLAQLFGTYATTGFAALLSLMRLRMSYSTLLSTCMCDTSVEHNSVRYYGLAAAQVLRGGMRRAKLEQLEGAYALCNLVCQPSE